MPDQVTPSQGIQCIECGELSTDHEWCDHCGARLSEQSDSPEATQRWFVEGERLDFACDGEEFVLEITELVEDFATRKIFLAQRVVSDEEDQSESLEDDLYYVEQAEREERADGDIPESVRQLFRRPLVTMRGEDDLAVEIYRSVGGLTLEDMVDLASEQLSYAQVKGIFDAVADAIVECHDNGQLVLAIAPWTVRLDGSLPDFSDEDTSPGSISSDHIHVDATEEFGRSTLEMPDTEILDEDSSGDLEELPEGEAESAGFDGELNELEMIREEVEEAGQDDFSAWDFFEDDGETAVDVTGDTGILPVDELETGVEEYRAIFEGLDRTYPSNVQPDEVPVIMGFSPPELLGRVRADVSEACDVFGLGMLLYFMIAGRTPPASVYTRYSPALPVRNFRAGFPPGLQPVISRATRPNPEDRYPSVEAMREAFRKACDTMEARSRQAEKESAGAPKFRLAVETHVGIGKRRRNPTNQDAVFGRASEDGRFALVVVADGVSTASYGSGDLASTFLAERAAEAWEELLPAYLMDEPIDEFRVIHGILSDANQDIVDHVNEHYTPFAGNPHEVMGTTSLVAILRDGLVTLASLGDSRCYLQNAQGLEQITTDHNLWSLSIIEGVPADSALAMPHGDALARCLGNFAIVQGQLESAPPDPDFFRFSVSPGDTVLLTTDGLVDFGGPNPTVAEENIQAIMVAEPDPALACLELILLANRGGGGDNVGLAIAQFH